MVVTTLTEFPVSALMTTVALLDVLITFAAYRQTYMSKVRFLNLIRSTHSSAAECENNV